MIAYDFRIIIARLTDKGKKCAVQQYWEVKLHVLDKLREIFQRLGKRASVSRGSFRRV